MDMRWSLTVLICCIFLIVVNRAVFTCLLALPVSFLQNSCLHHLPIFYFIVYIDFRSYLHVFDTISFYIFYKYFLKSDLKLILHSKISYAY